MNISIAIADSNREYVERLSEVLQQYAELSISIYYNGQKLQEDMNPKNVEAEPGHRKRKHFDIVLFDPDVSEEKLDFSNVKLPVCLYSDEANNRSWYGDCAKVLKYQRISNIYKEFIREYADKAGYSADFDHSQDTNMIAVYSPAGGSGKTTMALAIASRLASMGKTVLFISAEQLSSSSYVNKKQEEGITALVDGAADEHTNFELKIKGIMKQGMNGMYYVEGFDRIVDYDAVTGNEMTDVLNKIKRCGICDVMVIDMESNLDLIGRAVISLADRIVVVEKTGELPGMKMNLFARQAIVSEYREKMRKICNFAESNSVYSAEMDFEIVGTVHNYGNLQLKNVIQTINANNEIMIEKIIPR
ncbi:MAG: AAA family ATPase [bacterium]|nr:AAA family ATPase [bacterium]